MQADKIILSWTTGSIASIYEQAVIVAKQHKCPHVEFPFNGTKVVVTDRSPIKLTEEDATFIMESIGNNDYCYL